MINHTGALPAKHPASLRKNQMPALSILVAGLGVFAVSCKVGPNYMTPKAGVAGQWLENSTITNRPFSAAEDYWWRNFDDPVLNQLVETAFRNNPSLQAAGVRILGRAPSSTSPSAICSPSNRGFPAR